MRYAVSCLSLGCPSGRPFLCVVVGASGSHCLAPCTYSRPCVVIWLRFCWVAVAVAPTCDLADHALNSFFCFSGLPVRSPLFLRGQRFNLFALPCTLYIHQFQLGHLVAILLGCCSSRPVVDDGTSCSTAMHFVHTLVAVVSLVAILVGWLSSRPDV